MAAAAAPRHARAEFVRAVGLYPGSDVRILGVKVGKVTKVTPHGDRVRVDFEYDDRYTVPADAKAVVVSPSVVSDRYVQLTPVYTRGPRLADGARIRLDRHRGAGGAGPDLLQPQRPGRRARPEGRQQERRAVPAARRRRRQPRRRGRRSSTGRSTDLSQAISTLSDGRDDLFATVRNLQVFTTALATSDAPGARVQHRPGQRRRPAGRRARRARAGAEEPRGRPRRGGLVRPGQPGRTSPPTSPGSPTSPACWPSRRTRWPRSSTPAPVALSNLQNAYNPASGTLDTRDNAQQLDDPGLFLCSLLTSLGQPKTVCDQIDKVLKNKQLPAPGEPAGSRGGGPDLTLGGILGSDAVSGPAARRRPRAALLCAGSLTACQGVYDLPLPGGAATGSDAYRVTVEFADVLDLVPQSAVKVNDVTVGAVDDDRAGRLARRVTLRLRDSVHAARQRRGRAAADQPAGREVRLAVAAHRPSRREGRLGDGDTIPLRRSGRNPEVEEVLSALSLVLNGGGVAQLKTINVELTRAMAGHEEDIQGAIRQLDTFVGGLDAHKSEVVRALDGLDRLSARLAAQKGDIATAVDNLGPGLKVLADQRAQLTTMLTALSDLGRVGTRVINASKADTAGQPARPPADPHQAGRGRREPPQRPRDARHLPVPPGGDRRGAGRLHQPADHGRHRPADHPDQLERRQEPGAAVAAARPEPDRPAADGDGSQRAAALGLAAGAAAHVHHRRAAPEQHLRGRHLHRCAGRHDLGAPTTPTWPG